MLEPKVRIGLTFLLYESSVLPLNYFGKRTTEKMLTYFLVVSAAKARHLLWQVFLTLAHFIYTTKSEPLIGIEPMTSSFAFTSPSNIREG